MIGDDVIAIAAPFPAPDQLQEGWMRRIDSIDRQLRGVRRIYLSFSESHDDEEVSVIWRDDERGVAWVHPTGKRSVALIAEILGEVSLVYVHTLHYAEFMLRWLKRGRVCVDIHGITPEEEFMLGRPDLKERYENVERRVLNEALRCIVVSDAMIDHYREKYPDISPRWLTIPILEHTSDLSVLGERISEGRFHSPYRVIYCGGIQAWQNIGAMLEMVKDRGDAAEFAFYSQHHEVLREQAEALCVSRHIECGFKTAEQLKDVYTAADFGLILRDDLAVNRVSCPTKVAEYLKFGIIPIVRSPRLGDFHTHGFAYVTEEDFLAGYIPDPATRDWMIRQNARVLEKIGYRFSEGVAQLRQLIIQGESPKTPRRLYQRKWEPMAVKKIGGAYVVKGTVHAEGPVIDEDSGVRISDIRVALPPGLYDEPPIVFGALGSVDFQHGENSRLEVSILENSITKEEFCVRFRTWADTKVWSAYANWIAIGNASGEE